MNCACAECDNTPPLDGDLDKCTTCGVEHFVARVGIDRDGWFTAMHHIGEQRERAERAEQELSTARQEAEALRTQFAETERQRKSAEGKLDIMLAENARVQAEFTAAHSTWIAERNTMRTEAEVLRAERDAAITERDELNSWAQEQTRQREALRAENERLKSERDEAVAKADELFNARDAVNPNVRLVERHNKIVDELTADRDRLAKEVELLRATKGDDNE